MHTRCGCFIVPTDALEEFAADESLSNESRQALRETAALEPVWRKLRSAQTRAAQAGLRTMSEGLPARLPPSPR